MTEKNILKLWCAVVIHEDENEPFVISASSAEKLIELLAFTGSTAIDFFEREVKNG